MAKPEPFTEQELAKYREIFNHLDQDQDGKITHGDLKRALNDAGWGLSDAEVQMIVDKADKDKSGFITWEEFLKVAEGRPIKRRIEAALRRMFRAMDTDNTGYITATNLRTMLVEVGASDSMSDAELDAIIKMPTRRETARSASRNLSPTSWNARDRRNDYLLLMKCCNI